MYIMYEYMCKTSLMHYGSISINFWTSGTSVCNAVTISFQTTFCRFSFAAPLSNGTGLP